MNEVVQRLSCNAKSSSPATSLGHKGYPCVFGQQTSSASKTTNFGAQRHMSNGRLASRHGIEDFAPPQASVEEQTVGRPAGSAAGSELRSLYVHKSVCIRIFASGKCMYACIYAYIFIHTRIYLHIHIHIDIC